MVTFQADQDWILFLIGTGSAAVGAKWILLAAFLHTLAVRMKALAQTTLLYRVVSFLWRCVSAFVLEFPFP